MQEAVVKVIWLVIDLTKAFDTVFTQYCKGDWHPWAEQILNLNSVTQAQVTENDKYIIVLNIILQVLLEFHKEMFCDRVLYICKFDINKK